MLAVPLYFRISYSYATAIDHKNISVFRKAFDSLDDLLQIGSFVDCLNTTEISNMNAVSFVTNYS